MTGGPCVLVLAVSACGSSSTGAAANQPKPSKAADLALAKKSLVVLSDLPSGWTASGKVTSGSGSTGGEPLAKIAACLGVTTAQLNINFPTENSPTFNNPGGSSTVSDQVETFPSPARAGTDFSNFSNPKTPGCITTVFGPLLRQEVQKGGGAGTPIGAVTTTRQTFPAFGDQSGEMQIQAPFSTAGVSTSLYVDLVDIIKGRLETTLSFTTAGSAFDQTEAQKLAAAAFRHMS